MTTTPSPITSNPALIEGERFELPSGGWVQLRHLDDLRAKHRRQVTEKIPSVMRAVDLLDFQQEVARVMIVAWDLPYLPGAALPEHDPAVLEELSVKDENELQSRLGPVYELLNPRDVTPDDHQDPDSPTEPAADSGRGSRGSQSSPRVPANKRGGKRPSTRTGGSTASG